MEKAEIIKRKEALIAKYGPWTGHNIRLADDLYTISPQLSGDEIKLRRIRQIVADLSPKPVDQLRVLDLACLEGLYACEFARLGATAVGIEGREANIAKAHFAQEVLGLSNLSFHQDDVRNLSRAKYGEFDVVLCLGILYHLDAPDVFLFLEKIAEVCRGIVIIDTHIALKKRKTVRYQEKDYQGKSFREHSFWSSLAERQKALWASLDNPRSFWPTLPALLSFLTGIGFTSTYECLSPPEPNKPRDRITLVAVGTEPAPKERTLAL